jgi:hypothetical protein
MILIAVCLFGFSLLQASVIEDAPITRVTVYPDRAMVTRSVTTELSAGDHTILVENLPNQAHDNSFRAFVGEGAAQLLGLNRLIVRHVETPEKKAAELDKTIYELEKYTRQGIVDRKDVFEQQKKMLLSISFKSGEEMSEQLDKGGLEISQWKDAFAFIGDALMAINDSISVTGRELDDIDRLLFKLREDRRAISSQFSRQTKTVEIDVRLHRAGNIGIDLDYVITGASWKPVYDARLVEKNKKVDFQCFGEVTQRTGEDWTDVDLTLSTARPSQGTGPGDLLPWILSLYCQAHGAKKGIDFLETGTVTIKTQKEIISAPVSTVNDLMARETGITKDAEGELYIRGGIVGGTSYLVDGSDYSDPLGGRQTDPLFQIAASTFSTSFKVARKVSIPSGDEAVRTPIGNHLLDSKVDLLCRPRNRQGVYRLATITNQDMAPLLPGLVSIFTGSDYLGLAVLNRFVAPGDEFVLPFGKDDNIEVKREMIENKTSVKGDKIRKEQTIRITLSNNGNNNRPITVEEQLPVTRDSQIKVKLRDVKPEKDELAEDDNNKAVWMISLLPREEKTITMSYRIEYPANTIISGM